MIMKNYFILLMHKLFSISHSGMQAGIQFFTFQNA